MELIEWANTLGYTIRISKEDAEGLIRLLQGKCSQTEIEGTLYEVEFTE